MSRTQGNYYFTYYANLLKNGGIVADLTPAYTFLPEEICRRIMSNFEARGISFRAVYIMRDPVNRSTSHFMMNRYFSVERERWIEQVLGLPRDADLNQSFRAYIHLEHQKSMSDYKKAIDTLSAAYPEEQRMFVLFEEMIKGVKLKELSDFLGVSYRPDAIGAPVSPRESNLELDEEVLQECAQLYRPTYEAMAKMFPQTETLWPGWKYLR